MKTDKVRIWCANGHDLFLLSDYDDKDEAVRFGKNFFCIDEADHIAAVEQLEQKVKSLETELKTDMGQTDTVVGNLIEERKSLVAQLKAANEMYKQLHKQVSEKLIASEETITKLQNLYESGRKKLTASEARVKELEEKFELYKLGAENFIKVRDEKIAAQEHIIQKFLTKSNGVSVFARSLDLRAGLLHQPHLLERIESLYNFQCEVEHLTKTEKGE